MIKAKYLANYFTCLAKKDRDYLSVLPLMYMCYLAQGYHLVKYGEPTFGDKMYAWRHGAMIEGVYEFSMNQEMPECNYETLEFFTFDKNILFNCIYKDVLSIEGHILSEIGKQKPIMDAQKQGNGTVISLESMMEWFSLNKDVS